MNELYHHGILGQKWGHKNGPPYPLSGGDYSRSEIKAIYKAKKARNSIYNKKHFDSVIKRNDVLSTLSYDKNRTKNADMFYAAHDVFDKHQYNALFNKKVPQTYYDEKGNAIGTGMSYKFRINNQAKKNIKVASEDSGASAFLKLYASSRDFKNFVEDPKRMSALFVNSKYKFKGYRDAREALERVRKENPPKEDDLRTTYRMFNYVIPSDGSGDSRKANDIAKQRARLFAELEKEGYGALLDTNDAIYGAFKAKDPVIVFDMKSIVLNNIENVNITDKAISELAFLGRKALGL